jgi:glycosyltransferase involved in cell wall biosynthesis
MKNKRHKILIVGPIFKSADGYTGMPGMLIRSLIKEGNIVQSVSKHKNKIIRMFDILITVFYVRNKTDIILLQSFGQLAFIMEDCVSRLAQILKIPICFTLHGGAFYDFYKKHPKWVYRVLNRANEINTPSMFLNEKLESEGFAIKYIPNFINLDNFPLKRDVKHEKSLLWVRAFHDIYNPELAIEIVKVLKPMIPNIILTMIGPDQGKLEFCQSLISKYGLNDNIKIIGQIDNKDLFKYYQQNKIFLTTTRYESFGVSLIEAGACGIPCVSVGVGEIPYIWKDRENIIISGRDSNDFALKINELLNNTDLYNKISIQAHQNSEKFTWENVRVKWLETINKLNKI